MNSLAGYGVLFSSIRGCFSKEFVKEIELGRSVLLENLHGEELSLSYSSGNIDAMYFINSVDYKRNNPTVIMFLGMAESYERVGIFHRKEDCIILNYTKRGYNVLLWNYPGVSKSTGKPSLENVLDACDTVIGYILQFVPEKHIILHGHSMGGGISLMYAARKHKHTQKLIHPQLNVCCDRSFNNLSSAIIELMKQEIPLIGNISGLALGIFVNSICGWNLNSFENWCLPERKGYYWCMHHLNDEMIPDKSSIAYSLRKNERDIENIIELSTDNCYTIGYSLVDFNEFLYNPSHERSLTPKEWEIHEYHIKKALSR